MEPTGKSAGRAQAESGLQRAELVLQKGRHAGTRRVLEEELVLFGRAQGCDVRLTADGIASRHCLLARTPGGWVVRDLGSATGTYVDGRRVATAALTEGSLLAVGPMEFRLHLPPVPVAIEGAGDAADAVRIQAAAVAAQQAALDEEEARLEQRRTTLQQQEAQLAGLLEEKRQELEALREQAQATGGHPSALPIDLQEAGAACLEAQRASLEDQARAERERRRLVQLNKRLRRRFHRFWLAERRRLDRDRQVLQEEAALVRADHLTLEDQERKFQEARLRFAAFYELARRRLGESWRKLRQQRRRWKQRRGCERAALKVRSFDLDQAERRLVRAQELFLKEKAAWDEAKQLLAEELRGLRRRRDNLHRRLHLELAGRMEPLPLLEPEIVSETVAEGAAPQEGAPIPAGETGVDQQAIPAAGALVPLRPSEYEAEDRHHLALEAWRCLALVQERWEEKKRADLEDLQGFAVHLEEEARALALRDQEQKALDRVLQQRHEEMVCLRRHLIAWRARLRVEEQAWQGERDRLVELTRQRLEQADKQLTLVNEVRLRWNKRRRREMEELRGKRQHLVAEARNLLTLRETLQKALAGLDEEKRHFHERTLALEQLRQEVLRQTDPLTGKKRLERFRRRWITQQAESLRRLQQERAGLLADFASLRTLAQDIERTEEETSARRIDLAEKWAAWEHQELLAGTRRGRLEAELHQAEIQVRLTRQQLDKARDEVERIARALLAEPDPPEAALQSAA